MILKINKSRCFIVKKQKKDNAMGVFCKVTFPGKKMYYNYVCFALFETFMTQVRMKYMLSLQQKRETYWRTYKCWKCRAACQEIRIPKYFNNRKSNQILISRRSHFFNFEFTVVFKFSYQKLFFFEKLFNNSTYRLVLVWCYQVINYWV